MRRRNRFVPSVDGLEQRMALSGSGDAPPTIALGDDPVVVSPSVPIVGAPTPYPVSGGDTLVNDKEYLDYIKQIMEGIAKAAAEAAKEALIYPPIYQWVP